MEAKVQTKFIMTLGSNAEDMTEDHLMNIATQMEVTLNERFPHCRVHLSSMEIEKPEIDNAVDQITSVETFWEFYDAVRQWAETDDAIGDLDEFTGDRELIETMIQENYIHTWTEGGQGMSFTCWSWNKKARELLHQRHGIKYYDPTEEYE